MRNRGDLGETLGVDHIIDVLREDMTTGRIRPEQLSKMSMEQAVRRTAEYDAERAAAMAKASAEEMKGMTIAKEFEDGYKMVQLDKPGQFAKESDRMGHSVRGYEPIKSHKDWSETSGNSGYSTYGHGGWDAIKGGRAQVFSLRDAKNNPHVTIEVETQPRIALQEGENPTEDERLEWIAGLKNRTINDDVPFAQWWRDKNNIPQHEPLKTITQIKGKQNAAPKDDYQPMIQKFIREGNYNVSGDLANAGLIDVRGGYGARPAFVPDNTPRYITQSELDRIKRTGEFKPDQHFGEGGMKRGGRVNLANPLSHIRSHHG